MPRSRSPATSAGAKRPISPLKVLPRAIRLGSSMACLIGSFQASSATSVLALYSRMALPPGEPSAATKLPSWSSTMTGAIDERGRLPPCTALATGWPASVGVNEKSVSWLLSTKPPTVRPEPNIDSTVVVMETTSPSASTTTKWLVPADSAVASWPRGTAMSPGGGAAPACSPISCARSARRRDRAALDRHRHEAAGRRRSGRGRRT